MAECSRPEVYQPSIKGIRHLPSSIATARATFRNSHSRVAKSFSQHPIVVGASPTDPIDGRTKPAFPATFAECSDCTSLPWVRCG